VDLSARLCIAWATRSVRAQHGIEVLSSQDIGRDSRIGATANPIARPVRFIIKIACNPTHFYRLPGASPSSPLVLWVMGDEQWVASS
jgi:hypothetical protein